MENVGALETPDRRLDSICQDHVNTDHRQHLLNAYYVPCGC